MKPDDKIQTEVVHVVYEDGQPKAVIFNSKNGGNIQFFTLKSVKFDEVKSLMDSLYRHEKN